MKITFLGAGKLATAIARGVLDAGVAGPAELSATCRSEKSRTAFERRTGVPARSDNAAAIAASDVIIVGFKPQDLLAGLQPLVGRFQGKLVIALAAGVGLAALESAVGDGVAVIRVMTNTPSLVGRGAATYAMGRHASGAHAAVVEQIFGAVGEVHPIKESLIDACLGVAASGPAYVLTMIEALADGGVLMGLPRPLAARLAALTVAGTGELVLQTSEHPALLREAVTSPGGTTAAALEQLERGAFRSAVLAAVRAATERSRELGRHS